MHLWLTADVKHQSVSERKQEDNNNQNIMKLTLRDQIVPCIFLKCKAHDNSRWFNKRLNLQVEITN